MTLINSLAKNLTRIILTVIATTLLAATAASAQSTETVLHSFAGTDGAFPVGNLISDSAGNLYGATNGGGIKNNSICQGFEYCGVIFELSKSSSGNWTYNVLHEFTGGIDGANPAAGLAFDKTGNLYGTAQFGGDCSSAFGCGVVFELSPTVSGPWTETVLYSFQNGNDGGLPASQPAFDTAGNLYGSTINGGTGSCGFGVACGVVFELSPSASGPWTESVIYNFQGYGEGAEPAGPVVFDAKGNLYGTASIGGGLSANCGYPYYGCGIAFELSPSSSGGWTETELHSFNIGRGGAFPSDGVVVDSAGTVFGTASAGGNSPQYCGDRVPGCGIVYALKTNSSGGTTESVAFSFSGGSDGQNPQSGLTVDSAGNFYGTAYDGVGKNGATGMGVVFELTAGSNHTYSETVLYTFPHSGTKGSYPASSLIRDSAGNLYGTTLAGGTVTNDDICGGTCGVVYEIKP